MPLRWPIINPIFTRVMVSSGRQVRHVWTRALYMVAILAALTIMMMLEMAGSREAPRLADVGELLFVTVSIVQLVLILILSPIYTAGAISQERDAQTFSVLLATPLSNLQIVLGSLLSRLFFVLAILFSTLPIFALLYYFGGFEMRDVLLSYGIAASSAVLTGAMAIAVSIMTTGTRRVLVDFFLFIVGYVFGLWAIDHRLLPEVLSGYTAGSLDWLHPLGAILSTIRAGQVERLPVGMLSFREMLVQYPEYGYLLYSLSLSAVIVIVSAAFVRRLARGYGGLGRRLGRIALAAAGAVAALVVFAVLVQQTGLTAGLLAMGLLAVPAAASIVLVRLKRHRKPRSVWDNPVAWRERVTRTSTSRRTLVLLLYVVLSILALYVVLTMKAAGAPAALARDFVFLVTTVQMFVVLMIGATMAASTVSYEREQGTLDLLLTTPITPRYFIYGKLLGVIRYLGLFLGMILLITAGSYLVAHLPVERFLRGLMPGQWLQALGGMRNTSPEVRWDNWPLVAAVYPVMVTAGMAAAVVSLGMTFSLRAKNTTTAAVHAALSVLGIVAVVTGCCWLSGSVWIVGPLAALLSPFLANYAALKPEDFMAAMRFDKSATVRAFFLYAGLHLGVLGAVTAYVLFAWFRLRAMVRTFDLQTRQKK